MRFYRDGEIVRVVQIAGPTHNMVGLGLSGRSGALDIEELAAPGVRQLVADDICLAVCASVDQANVALGTRLRVSAFNSFPPTAALLEDIATSPRQSSATTSRS